MRYQFFEAFSEEFPVLWLAVVCLDYHLARHQTAVSASLGCESGNVVLLEMWVDRLLELVHEPQPHGVQLR